MKELKIRLMERMLGAKLTAHLGYEEGKDAPADQANRLEYIPAHYQVIVTLRPKYACPKGTCSRIFIRQPDSQAVLHDSGQPAIQWNVGGIREATQARLRLHQSATRRRNRSEIDRRLDRGL